MKLLTEEIKNKLPKLYTNENKKSENTPIIAKFFCPWNSWAWYATEFDGIDIFFGWVHGDFPELSYFSLNELQSVKGPLGLGIERDKFFGKHTLAEVKKKEL